MVRGAKRHSSFRAKLSSLCDISGDHPGDPEQHSHLEGLGLLICNGGATCQPAPVRLIFFIDGLNFELFGGVGEIASFRPYLKTAWNLHDLKDTL